jgi:hypothetical protein
MSRIPGIVAVIAGGFVLTSTAGLAGRQARRRRWRALAVDSALKLPKATDAMTDKLAIDLESGRFRVMDREWLGPEAVNGRGFRSRVRSRTPRRGLSDHRKGLEVYRAPEIRHARPHRAAIPGGPFARYATAPQRVSKGVDYSGTQSRS